MRRILLGLLYILEVLDVYIYVYFKSENDSVKTLRAYNEVGRRNSCARALSPITPVSPPQGRRRTESGQWRARGGAGRAVGPASRGPREARARGSQPQGGRRARAARAQAAATQGASHVRTPPPRAHALTHFPYRLFMYYLSQLAYDVPSVSLEPI